jgi:glutamine synthetase type III
MKKLFPRIRHLQSGMNRKKADVLQQNKTSNDELREYVDELENLVDDEIWPQPKFWEMLFIS